MKVELSEIESGVCVNRSAFIIRVNLQRILQIVDALLFLVCERAFEPGLESLLRNFGGALDDFVACEGKRFIACVENVESQAAMHTLEERQRIAEIEDARGPASVRHHLAHQTPFVDLDDARRADQRRVCFVRALRDAVRAEHDHRRVRRASETDSGGERGNGRQWKTQALIGKLALVV